MKVNRQRTGIGTGMFIITRVTVTHITTKAQFTRQVNLLPNLSTIKPSPGPPTISPTPKPVIISKET